MPLPSFKHLFHKAKGDSFVTGSIIIFVGSVLVGGVNYVYQFLMARMLPVDKYGELQSLLAILAVIAVFSNAISFIITKYSADFAAKNEWNKVYSLVVSFSEKVFLACGVGSVLYILFSGQIATFLNLSSRIEVILLSVALIFGFTSSVTLGVSRGLQKFKEVSIILFCIALVKLIFSVLLLKIGFSVNGAVGAVGIAALLGYGISFYPIKFLYGKKREPVGGKSIFIYSLPVLASLLCTTLLWSVDIILVKHYFPSETAGQYAALSMLGHILFFVLGPIGLVLFPMAAKAHANNEFPAKILKKALALTFLIGLLQVFGFFIFPKLIIHFLVSDKFLSIAPYVGWFTFSMFLYSLVNLMSSYFLSIGETKSVWLLLLGALTQIILLVQFHDTLWNIVWVMNGSLAFTVILLVGYFIRIYYLCPRKK